jgi:glycosyltransferase involved in cell wall biosynthesis
LHVAGYNTAAVLKTHGVDTTVFPVRHNIDIVVAIDKYNAEHPKGLTHVVISAPWIHTWDLTCLIEHYPDIQFVVVCHSNVGFLMADPRWVQLLRQGIALSKTHKNLVMGGNSTKFVEWMRVAYEDNALLLPNLYPLEGRRKRKRTHDCPRWKLDGLIKIGSFGGVRPYKNHITAAAAAVAIHKILRTPVEFHMSTGGEGGICNSINELCADIPGFTLVKHPWAYWNDFVKVTGEMDLLMQVSFTESFNLVTADGVYMGVPTVVSSAINWAPSRWRADSDDAIDVARKGIELLFDGYDDSGVRAIERHNRKSAKRWIAYLEGRGSKGDRAGVFNRSAQWLISWLRGFGVFEVGI